MNNVKKLGLTALAGSLVAFTSASAGELSVSGGAKLSFTNKGGNEAGGESAAGDTGNGFGMQQAIVLSGSGELDNGMTVSLTHILQADAGTGSTSTIALDMGSMGTIEYHQSSGSAAIGIEAFDDVMPTAEEEVGNGLGIVAGNSATTEAITAYTYQVDHAGNGFSYNWSNDMMTIVAGYTPNAHSAKVDDGNTAGTADGKSGYSIGAKVSPMDGLTLYAGTGERGRDADKQDDMDTYAATYSMGPVSVGAQRTEIDVETNTGQFGDSSQDNMSIAFAINENLSVSYGVQDTEIDGKTLDQEVEGFSVGYSMGGISINAHSNKGENMGGTAANEIEHTEVSVSFAF